MANFSFDIESGYDKAEMNNVFDQTQREIDQTHADVAKDHLVASQTDIPTPTIHTFDNSRTLVSFPYLLLERPRGVPLALARASGKLSPRQLALLDLRTGAYLKQLHERVQNDWFGQPAQSAEQLYSWQEAFTLLVECVIDDARSEGVELPYQNIRQYLSRAIGFYLFDDCEVPSLIAFTADRSTQAVLFCRSCLCEDDKTKDGYGGRLCLAIA